MAHLELKPPIEGKTGYCEGCSRLSPMRFRLECGPLPAMGVAEAFDIEYFFCRWHWAAWRRAENKRLQVNKTDNENTQRNGTHG